MKRDHNSEQQQAIDKWMLICQHISNQEPTGEVQEDVSMDWTASSENYPNIEKAPSFKSKQQQN